MIQSFIQTYTWYFALSHCGLAILLFFLINWIGARSISVGYMQMSIVIQEDSAPAFNFLFKVLAPIVYMVLCAVFFQSVNLNCLINNCYLIVVYYWGFRFLWIVATNRGRLTNWLVQCLYWICSIGLSVWVYSIIDNVDRILPEPRALLDQMWILIIAFVYSVLNKITSSGESTIKRKNNYIKSRYKAFYTKYNLFIHGFFRNNFFEALTYSIMIYEDFNRPYIIRKIENFLFYVSQRPITLGIMQIKTKKYINDKDSVILAMKKIAHDSNSRLAQEIPSHYKEDQSYWLKEYILEQYNGGSYKYLYEVSEIYDYIAKEFYKGDIPKKFSQIPEEYNN